jgi:hypothetical protein
MDGQENNILILIFNGFVEVIVKMKRSKMRLLEEIIE